MPAKFIWSNAHDTRIRQFRAEGASWDAIATVLGLSRWAIIDRGRRIGARLPPREFVPPPEDPARDPMPAGHPRSWGVITTGTVLENTAYPLPVFTR
ncbi:MAG: AsnC family protein [Acetobacteraceae bacterium]